MFGKLIRADHYWVLLKDARLVPVWKEMESWGLAHKISRTMI
jgi:hypothetical protein